MNTKYIINLIALSFLLTASFILIGQVSAQNSTETANIQYPIEELDNCKDETACRAYCDKQGNREVCFDFAEKNNLMSKEEIDSAKNFIAVEKNGPGGCAGKEECNAYCNDIGNIDECVTFAVENNLMSPKELEEAKKIQAAIKRGVKPPPCGGKEQCDIYCNGPDHMEECITFGIEAGFIQGKELEDSQKMLAAVKRGIKPPSCHGKEACDQYCGDPEHMEECMTFAMEAGFMDEKEKANSQKMLEALKKGAKPPNCKGKEECDVYCTQEEHFEECITFGEVAGFMTPEEATMARKTGGKGPNGCKGKEECDAFCNNPDNQQTCFDFGKENGMIPEEDLKMMEEGKQRFQETLNNMPQEVSQCLNSSVGTEMVEKFKSGVAMPPREIGDKMKECFEKMGPPGPGVPEGSPGAGGMIPPAGQTGPGGCKTEEECTAYCESHPDECQKFQPSPGVINPGEQMMPRQAGPGGCKDQDECKTYCESHPDECKNFSPNNEGQFVAPGTGPSGPEGQPGEPQTKSNGCQTPEECQKMMPPPAACEGENCQYGPPPSNQSGEPGQQPPPEGQKPPEFQQPPINQPPANQFSPTEQQPPNPKSPPDGEQPPPSEPPPPPPSENPPAPSGFLNPNSLLGAIVNFFVQIFSR
ncbi:hypothetical protein KJ786_01315 [Patescibacteria group bacterium]|nr:hypothetical protein [Patescibacteria group bacterium]